MFEERKLRKIIESRTTPDMTFEKICEKRGINVNEIHGGGPVKAKSQKNMLVIGMSVATACLCIITCILLAVFLPRKGKGDFNELNTKKEIISYEQLVVSETRLSFFCCVKHLT